MAKTYTLQGTVNAGFSTRWTDDDWREYTTANSLSGDDNKRRIIGKYNSNYRAVNITFDSAQLAALRNKTVTSVSLTVKLLVGEVAANSTLYKIGFKKNATASSSSTSANAYARESGSTTNGYVHKASSKMTAGNTYTITGTDGLSQSVPSYGYAIGVSQSATAYIILDTTATLTVVTNETDYTLTLSYDANGGTGAPSAQSSSGTTTGTPSATFTISATKPTRANASAGSYTITYNANSGSVSPASASAARTTSYTFSKWNTQSGGGGTNYNPSGSITITANTKLYAQWSSSTTTASVTLPTPTRDGYNFNGWYTSGGTKVGNAGASYTPPSNITLYAQWTIKTYTVSYNANGGSDAPDSQTKTHGTDLTLSSTKPTKSQTTTTYTVTYNANSGTVSPASATATKKTTYTFSTWNTKSDGTGNSYGAGGKYTANASATLYARYTGSTSTTSVTLPTPTRTGYTFNGWYTAASGGTKIGNGGASYTPTATITIYAQWTIVKYTISYNANGGNASSVPDSQKKDYNESGFKLSSTVPTHADGTTKYTVTYNANEGSVDTANATATKTTTYTFSKWNTAANGSGTNYAAGASYTANANATMYAQWTSSASTTSVTLPTPSRTGYTFNGWYTAASGGTKIGNAGASYTPTATITLYAQWTIITYTITYNKGTYGTGTNTTATKNYGVELKLKDAIFTRTGYTQKGWSTAQAGDSKAYDLKASYTANSAKTLYPYWEANTYAVTYNANGGSGAPSSQTKTYGASLTLRTGVPTRSGYNFLGWATSSTGAVAYQPGDSYTTNAAVTLYAVWAAATSTVSTTNGTLGTAQTITINRNSSSYTHNLSYTYGSQTGAIADGVGTSFSWTPDPSMASAFPSSTSGTCTITCVTKSGNTTIGTTTTTCTLSIPSSIKPSGVALTASHYSANSTVSGWATFTKGYSQANLSVAYTLNGGATLASITFSGPGMSSTGTSTTARTSVLTTSGTNTWTVTVKDSRGRTASATTSKTVYDYANPVISSIGTYRCDSDGTINNGSGTYAKFLPKFSASSVNSKNSVQSAKLKWRVSGGSWSSQINVTNNTYTAVLGSGNIDITKTYEVSVTVTDKLNSTTATATLPSASGLWYGRGNDRLGLGGVPPSAGLHCDWDATFNGVLDVTKRRCYAAQLDAGWHRVLTFYYGTSSSTGEAYAKGATGTEVVFHITRRRTTAGEETHDIKMLCGYNDIRFVDEASASTSGYRIVDKVRYNYSGSYGYVDIRLIDTVPHVTVAFEVYCEPAYQALYTAAGLQSVGPSPSGETVLTEYSFAANTEASGTVTGASGFTPGEVEVKRSGRVVYVHFYVQNVSIAANTNTVIGTLSGVPLPKENIRWLAGGGVWAYNAVTPVYAILKTNGEIAVTSPSAISAVNITISYIV